MRGSMPDFEMPTVAEFEHAQLVAYEAALVRQRDLVDLGRAGIERAAAVEPPTGAPVGVPRSESSSPRTRLGRFARSRAAAFLAGFVLAGGVGIGWPLVQQALQRGTEAELQRLVGDYVAALESDDVETAMRLDGMDPELSDRSLLDAGARPEEPPIYTCEDPRVRDEAATVRCEVQVSGFGAAAMRIDLARDGGWHIERGLGVPSPLYLREYGIRNVGGVAVDPDDVPQGGTMWLYPGSYAVEVRVPAGMQLTGDADDARLMVSGEGVWPNIGLDFNAALDQQIRDMAMAFVDECATTAPPLACAGLTLPPDPDGYAVRSVGPWSGFGSERDATVFVEVVPGRFGSGEIVNLDVVVTWNEDFSAFELRAQAP